MAEQVMLVCDFDGRPAVKSILLRVDARNLALLVGYAAGTVLAGLVAVIAGVRAGEAVSGGVATVLYRLSYLPCGVALEPPR